MKRILIDSFGGQKRIALTENGELLELIFDNGKEDSIAGNIYCGKIESVVPGMQAAFVDIGRDKNAYMYYGKERAENDENNTRKNRPKAGTDIIVKVEKDGVGTKGAVVTEKISYTGKFVVILPDENNIGISKKIVSKEERQRIKSIIEKILPENYGIIVRTEGEGKSLEEYEKEINSLLEKSRFVEEKGKYIKAPALILKDAGTAFGIIRELFSDDIDELVVNDREYYNELLEYGKEYEGIKEKLKFYDSNIPLFEEYFIESKVEKALQKKVWLKSGGFLIIEETEACVVIDVNTGKFTGSKNFQKTIMKTNIEACYEVAKQIRLRNLSGMIIVDFIDIKDNEDKIILRKTLESALSKDRIKTVVVGMTELCLMQITRKKVRPPLSHSVMYKCKECNGTGMVYSVEWTVNAMRREVIKIFNNTVFDSVTIKCDEKLFLVFKGKNDNILNYIEKTTGKKVYFIEDRDKKFCEYEILNGKCLM